MAARSVLSTSASDASLACWLVDRASPTSRWRRPPATGCRCGGPRRGRSVRRAAAVRRPPRQARPGRKTDVKDQAKAWMGAAGFSTQPLQESVTRRGPRIGDAPAVCSASRRAVGRCSVVNDAHRQPAKTFTTQFSRSPSTLWPYLRGRGDCPPPLGMSRNTVGRTL
jgi:hypothetical protein